ncbi:MAG: protein kinase [Candidatus Margulisiibacteriota bacterium]|nr:protein kinase [Candidatus Margulisiibacteriota bacterium]
MNATTYVNLRKIIRGSRNLKPGERVALQGKTQVFKVRGPKNQWFALKVARTSSQDHLLREAMVLDLLLPHPNITALHGCGRIDGNIYLEMEYVDSADAKRKIKITGPFPEAEVLRINQGISSALSHAHQHGLAHGDVKTENILPGATVKLADFERARPIAGQEKINRRVVGTLQYMTLSHMRGYPIRPQDDHFGLGLSLYEMLTGEVALANVKMPWPSVHSETWKDYWMGAYNKLREKATKLQCSERLRTILLEKIKINHA